MNRRYNDLVSIGYRCAGTYNDRQNEQAKEHAKSLRVDGTKAVVVSKTEVTHFRSSTSKNTYLIVMELPSETTVAKRKAEREATTEKIRQSKLKSFAKDLTMEDIIFMLEAKRQEEITKQAIVEAVNND